MGGSNVQASSLKQKGRFDSGEDALAFQDDPEEERLLERNLSLKSSGCCSSSAHDSMEPFYFEQDFASPAASRSSSIFSTLGSASLSSRSEGGCVAKCELEAPGAILPTSYRLHAMQLLSTASSDTHQKFLKQQRMEYMRHNLFEKCKKLSDEDQIREELLAFRESWEAGSSNWDSDVDSRTCHEDIPRDKPLTLIDLMNQETKLDLLSQDLVKCNRANDDLSSKDDMANLNREILQDGTVDFYAVGKGRIWEHSKSYHEKPKQTFSGLSNDDLFPVCTSPKKIERVRSMETQISHQRSLSSGHAEHTPLSLGVSSADELKHILASITKGHHKHECENRLNDPRTPIFNRTEETLSSKVSSAVKTVSSKPDFRKSTLDNLQSETSCDFLSKAGTSGLRYTGIDKQLKKGSEAVLVLASENACRTDCDTEDTSLARGKSAAMTLKGVSKSVTNRTLSYAIKKLFAGMPSTKNEHLSRNVTPDVQLADVPIKHSNNGCLPSKMAMGSRKLATVSPVRVGVSHSVSRICTAGSFAVHSRLYCSVMDGVPSYAFVMEDCQDVLIAKAVGATMCDGDLTHVFYSWKNHGNTKVNWESWKKFEKVDLSFVGKMKASCKFREDANDCKSEAKQYMHLEFVILEAETSVATNAIPSDSSKRILYSSWERSLQPQISPVPSPNHSVYSPGIYSGSAATPSVSSKLVPLKMVTRSMASTPKVHDIGIDANFIRMPSLHCSPLATRTSMNFYSDHHCRSYPRQTEETHSELAAVVIRIPCNSNIVLGSSATSASNSNAVPILKYFSRKRIDTDRRLETLSEDSANRANIKSTLRSDFFCPKIEGMTTVSGLESTRTELELHSDGVEVRSRMQRHHFRSSSDLSSIIVILPAGDHGRPMKGSCGPLPLIDRWRSGGKCDCGSWDLGCGLTILNGQQEEAPKSAQQFAAKSENSNDFPTICFQVRKQEGVWMSLAQVCEGLFSVGFQAPITPLQAFASAVAVLHSRNPFFILTKHENRSEVRLTPISAHISTPCT